MSAAPVTPYVADPLDVLVIGGGQAGLAVGYHLARRNARFLIVDAAPAVGHAWRSRWDSLRLFSPAQYDGLPGMPFPAPEDTHPGKDAVADYLTDYARHFRLPLRLSTRVDRLHRAPDGTYEAVTTTGLVRARQVVVATGPFQKPYRPTLDGQPDSALQQLHSAEYRNPSQVLGGRVLVVGAGNSGLQIAAELARTHTVTVSAGSRSVEVPQRLAGKDIFFWLSKARFFTLPAGSRVARRLRQRGDLVIGSSTKRIRARGVEFRPRLTDLDGTTAVFTDGSDCQVDAVVWATGYRADYSWIQVPGAVVDGRFDHDRGVAASPGLYFLGLPWQTSRGSALLGFVGADAAAIAAAVSVAPVPPQRRGAEAALTVTGAGS
ncbi:MAG: flavin-containing monooxygenase [Actinomycetales bacterium]